VYIAKITFHLLESVLREDEQHELERGLYHLLGAWRHNGQIGDVMNDIIQQADTCITYVHILEKDSLHAVYNRPPVEAALEVAKKCLRAEPEVRIIGKVFDDDDSCQCTDRASYILFCTMLSRGSPLRCGTCFRSVPLYRIPPTSYGTYQDIERWCSTYLACDTLNLHSDVLEKAAINEMSKHNSRLSKAGRAICCAIEQHTGKPTYYYLYRARGRSKKKERKRRCPECGKKWLLSEKWHDLFDFRCDRCRLLSNIAWDVRGPGKKKARPKI
jgi:predicted  nucleic acid-binding Zn ribbon protein